MVKLLRVVHANNPAKKWRAEFSDGKAVEFGATGYTDFTLSKNKEQRDRYRARHAKDLLVDDPITPAFLSYYILWGDSTNMGRNIATYKRMFSM